MNNYFKKGKNDIYWIGSNFQEHFGKMNFVEVAETSLQSKKLERDMLDSEILAEWKPEECTLGDIAYALKNWEKVGLLRDGYANIFYIRDNDNTLWAVGAYWRAGSVTRPGGWDAGDQVVSRKLFDPLTSPKASDPLESRINTLENQMMRVIDWASKIAPPEL